jgi:membrane peptidoglycan carboxypeptidase
MFVGYAATASASELRSCSSMRRPRLVTCSLLALGVLAASLAAAATWAWFAYPLPTGRPAERLRAQLLVDGEELAVVTVPGEARAADGAAPLQEWTPLSRIPAMVTGAVIAAEDQRFMRHMGVDLLAIGHALLSHTGETASLRGASTITQQLARSLFLTRERTWWRKVREAGIALWLERRYTKSDILETYLNTVYLGQAGGNPVLGVAAAAHHHFGKDLGALTLDEAALLATAIRAPSRAFADVPWRLRARRDVVLHAMAADGMVSESVLGAALAAPVRLAAPQRSRAPWFVELAREETARRVLPDGAPRETGLARVATTLDRGLTRVAEAAVRQQLTQAERAQKLPAGTLQAAVVAMEPGSGHIRVLLGGRDYRESTFNRAFRARRQPGSLFKPFVYLAAFEGETGAAALTAASTVDDEPLAVWSAGREWTPQNIDHRFRGVVTVRHALEASLNVPAARIAQQIGPARVTRLARAFGIESPLAAVPSIALGTSEATLLEMTAAFAVLANGGYRVRPTTLDDTASGAALRPLPTPVRVVSPESAFIVTHLLRGVMSRGTGAASARWGLQNVTAGKTGTSDGLRDAWLVGYTPDLVVGVWVGADDARSIGLTGSEVALPIWAAVMQAAVRRAEPRPFRPPYGVVMAPVDAAGHRVCGGGLGITEAFREGSEPPPCEEGLVAATMPSTLVPSRSTTVNPLTNSSDRPEVGR